MGSGVHNHPPWRSIAILSMTALAYEVLLMRLFSIIQWHHFAYMIISLALLGYGASGAFLTIFREKLLPRYVPFYLGSIAFFGITALGSYLGSQHIQFNAEEILWAPEHAFRLMVIYLLLVLPFFFAANAIGLSLIRYRRDLSRIYAADLFGAGVGALLIIMLLFIVLPGEALRYISVLGMVARAIGSWELYREKVAKKMPLLLLLIVLPLALPGSWFEPELSPYKGLSQTLRIGGAEVVGQRSSPLGLISVVESPRVPFRHAPGMSLNAVTEPPEQVGLFIDGDAMTVITHDEGDRESFSYLDQLTSALPYHLNAIDDAIILGAGGGSGVLQARYHHVKEIRAVELDTNIIDLVQSNYGDFSGHIYSRGEVKIIAEEARGYVSSEARLYELIQLELFDSYSASSAGLYALSESYLYTVEALEAYLEHLKPEGFLAISRWIKLPPRDTLKLFATAIATLKRSGIDKPEEHLLLIRTLQTSTLLIKRTPITAEEIERAVDFARERSFDLAWYPGMSIDAANRHNQLAEPYFFMGAKALLGDADEEFIDRYKFNLEPATDDRPFFFHFFKWQVLPEILSLTGKGGMPLLEWGYLILVATLLQALFGAAFLVLLPLLLYRRKRVGQGNRRLTLHSFVYFLSLGLAFLFIEIAFIQKFILFLHHPTFAIAVVLAAFLIFAGMGSLWSKGIADSAKYEKGVRGAVVAIVIIGLLYILLLGPLFSLLMALPIVVKIIISLLLIAPLAFAMGIPFPLGLSRLGQLEQELIPWVWGVNGCASVLSAILATLLAIHYGFTVVILLALMLYIASAVTFSFWQH
ncbi:MAG: SAM-dependent methyltransferase [Gammaproteobacteria bacterium]|nr:SAM-dependent methyltransferase [Gammaproteobacteria bacterium]